LTPQQRAIRKREAAKAGKAIAPLLAEAMAYAEGRRAEDPGLDEFLNALEK
jgi:hypothetical protein